MACSWHLSVQSFSALAPSRGQGGLQVIVTRPLVALWVCLCVGPCVPWLCPPEPSWSKGVWSCLGGPKVGLPGPLPGGAWCPHLGSEGPGAAWRHCVPRGGRPCTWQHSETLQRADGFPAVRLTTWGCPLRLREVLFSQSAWPETDSLVPLCFVVGGLGDHTCLSCTDTVGLISRV